MYLVKLETVPLPPSLLREYMETFDKALAISDWFDQFENAPSLTNQPKSWDVWVDIIEGRLKEAAVEEERYRTFEADYKRNGLNTDRHFMHRAAERRNKILNWQPWG